MKTTPTEKKKPRTLDHELRAMHRIDCVLAELDDSEVERVLTWLFQRHGFGVDPGTNKLGTNGVPEAKP